MAEDAGQEDPRAHTVTLSSEEHQKFIIQEVTEQAKNRVISWITIWGILFTVVSLGLGVLGFSFLDTYVRKALQPHLDALQNSLTDLKVEERVARDTIDQTLKSGQSAAKAAQDAQEHIKRLRDQAQAIQAGFDTLNQRIELAQKSITGVTKIDLQLGDSFNFPSTFDPSESL